MNTNIRNLDKIDKFLDKYKLLKLKLKEIENLSYSIKEIEFFFKKKPTHKETLGPNGFTIELYQYWKKT